MLINYAHRGASAYYPENTMSAFYAGLRMGANGIETDIHRTRDGVLVLFHDDTLERVTEGSGAVTDCTYEELLALTVCNRETGRRDKIVRFEDFLRYFSFRDLTFAVELKQDHVERETIELLEAYGMREKTVLTSFHFDNLRRAREIHPGYRLGGLTDLADEAALEQLRAIGAEEICPRAQTVRPEDVRRWHAQGLSVRAWGVYTPELMREMCRCGVDGMTVNFPDLLTACLQEGRE